MSKTKILVVSFRSKTNELFRQETIINIKIVQEEIGWDEHCYLALKFIEWQKECIDLFREQIGNNERPIDAEEFWEWLKKENFIK